MKPRFSTVWVALLLGSHAVVAGAVDLQLTQVSDRTGIVDITNDGDDFGHLFLVEQVGQIFIIESGAELATPFLDIRGKVGSAGAEQGLLSLAFPPDYLETRAFYVWYTNLDGDTVLERYYTSAEDVHIADADSGEVILEVAQPFPEHNGGRLRFGADGMLYLGLGDGGGSFDPENNAQSGDTLLGKLIRIDVDPSNITYAIPPDNPFVGDDGVLDEIWAMGLRNPWRTSFDRDTGDLFIADVGADDTEEINFQSVGSSGGENYGWAIMEGSQCVEAGCDQTGLTLPVAEYSHDEGCSVTGGEVYRGGVYPDLMGTYLFGDFCSGLIWGLSRAGEEWQVTELLDSNLEITTFGIGKDRSVYVAGAEEGVYLVSDGAVQTEPAFFINSSMNDAWLNPATPGQGFFMTVFPATQQVFLAWFTFDTERPAAGVTAELGDPGHRWRTALGTYAGATAELGIELTQGGVFNVVPPTPTQEADGTITLDFADCNTGTVTYDITSAGLQGTIPIERVAAGNLAACEAKQ